MIIRQSQKQSKSPPKKNPFPLTKFREIASAESLNIAKEALSKHFFYSDCSINDNCTPADVESFLLLFMFDLLRLFRLSVLLIPLF